MYLISVISHTQEHLNVRTTHAGLNQPTKNPLIKNLSTSLKNSGQNKSTFRY